MDVAKRGSRKTLSSPPPLGTWTLQQFAEQLSMRTTWRVAEKSFTALAIGRNHNEMVGRVYTLKTHNPRETIHKCEESPKEWGIWVPHQAPEPRGPALKRWAPRTAGWEDQHGFHTGKLEGCRTQKCRSNGHTENLTGATKSQRKGSNREGAWVRPTFWSWRASQKGRRRLGLTLETQVPTAIAVRTLVVANTILESSL